MKKILIILLLCVSAIYAQDKFTLYTDFMGGATKQGELNKFVVRVLNSEGRLQYRINRNVQFDEPKPNAKIFADGSIIIIRALSGEIEFISNEGESVVTKTFGRKNESKYERGIYPDISDSTLVVAVVSAQYDGYFVLLGMNSKGERLFKNNIYLENSDGVKFINKDMFMVSCNGWDDIKFNEESRIFDTKGELIKTLPVRFRKFVETENKLLGWTPKSLFLLDKESIKLDFVKKYEEKFIVEAEIIDNKVSVTTALKENFVEGKVVFEGSEAAKYKFDGTIEE